MVEIEIKFKKRGGEEFLPEIKKIVNLVYEKLPTENKADFANKINSVLNNVYSLGKFVWNRDAKKAYEEIFLDDNFKLQGSMLVSLLDSYNGYCVSKGEKEKRISLSLVR